MRIIIINGYCFKYKTNILDIQIIMLNQIVNFVSKENVAVVVWTQTKEKIKHIYSYFTNCINISPQRQEKAKDNID